MTGVHASADPAVATRGAGLSAQLARDLELTQTNVSNRLPQSTAAVADRGWRDWSQKGDSDHRLRPADCMTAGHEGVIQTHPG